MLGLPCAARAKGQGKTLAFPIYMTFSSADWRIPVTRLRVSKAELFS
jgi:hypothetical protein